MSVRRRACTYLSIVSIILILSLRRNSDVDVKCPVEEGDYEVTQTVALPKEIPRGTILSSLVSYKL